MYFSKIYDKSQTLLSKLDTEKKVQGQKEVSLQFPYIGQKL